MKRAGWSAGWVLATWAGCSATATPTHRPPVAVEVAPSRSSHDAAGAADGPSVPSHCLQTQLTRYIESIGSGWPPAYRPTGVVLVAAQGRTLYAQGFGAADRERGISPTPDTSFRIGSISKGFAAVAILQLVEAGKLHLDGHISQYLPEYPAVGARITVHQLLSHTSGLGSYNNEPSVASRLTGSVTPRQILASFWNEPLAFEPGTGYQYSNSGYAVLGAIIERLSGLSYAEYLQRFIWGPAGMTRTIFGDAEGLNDRALGYRATVKGQLEPVPDMDLSSAFVAGGIRSTANDLARWHMALQGGDLLGAASKQRLYTPVEHHYAYGWMVDDRHGPRVVGHGGVIAGFNAALARVPELGIAVVVLLNSEALPAYLISEPARRCALGEELTPQPAAPLVELDARARARVLGSYVQTAQSRQSALAKGLPKEIVEAFSSLRIVEDDGALFVELAGQRQLLLATSTSEFVIPAVMGQLHAHLPEGTGSVASGVELQQGTDVSVFERRGAE